MQVILANARWASELSPSSVETLSYPNIWDARSSSLEHGWTYDDDDKLEPKWSNGPILPQKLIDIIPGSEPNEAESDSDDEGSEEEVSDIEDIVYSDADSEVE